MAKKIYVGNLPFSTYDDEIRNLFAAHGEVLSVSLITDRETGRLRGFGFVEMNDEGALAAIQSLNGSTLGGRSLRVNEAEDKPRAPRSNGYEGHSRRSW